MAVDPSQREPLAQFLGVAVVGLDVDGAFESRDRNEAARPALHRTLESIVRVVCLIALGAVVVSAQPGGQLTGVVRDITGSVVPGVTVTVSGATLIAPRTVVTDEHGEYVVDALPAGRYLVTAAFSGFEPTSTAIEVGATAATLNLVLAVSSVAERVTVTATKTGAADVQSTPVAITVLPATALEQMGVHTVEGLAGVVPTVTISQNTGAAQLTIRGIGTNTQGTGADPSSTVHLDGVYLGRPAMVFTDFLNVERDRSPAGAAGDALRAQLGRRDHQHRHQAADQYARDERSADRRRLRRAPRRRRRKRTTRQEQGDGWFRLSPWHARWLREGSRSS